MKTLDYSLPFEPQLLAALLAVADLGSVSAAAHALHRSQPAVTAQLRRLEDQLGARLFTRRPRGMSLTAAGRAFLESARAAHESLGAAAKGLSREAEPEGCLELWASTTIASYVLPPLLARYAAERPRVAVRLEAVNTQEVLERLRSGGAALGLVEGHGRAPGLRLTPFIDDELIAVADPSFQPRAGGFAALKERPLLWRERGSGTRAVVERALREAGLARELPVRFELGGTEAIKAAAVAGLGIAFLSRWSIRRELALGLLRPVPGRGLALPRAFRWALAGGGLSGLARDFHDFARRGLPSLA
ncbi:MAG: LysR family transcriptional regulator [Elusimicrobia bacterium]|nr:LysR family transcriptional regulator [Elusimicrobiota bacterium]